MDKIKELSLILILFLFSCNGERKRTTEPNNFAQSENHFSVFNADSLCHVKGEIISTLLFDFKDNVIDSLNSEKKILLSVQVNDIYKEVKKMKNILDDSYLMINKLQSSSVKEIDLKQSDNAFKEQLLAEYKIIFGKSSPTTMLLNDQLNFITIDSTFKYDLFNEISLKIYFISYSADLKNVLVYSENFVAPEYASGSFLLLARTSNMWRIICRRLAWIS
jgi:hypothetical protein